MTPLARRAMLFAPFAFVAIGGAGFYGILQAMRTGAFDPRGVPSALIGRRPPDFVLPPLDGVETPGFGSADLRGIGAPALVNFWASWCPPCIIEHPQLMRLAREGVPVFGIAYKDRPEDSLRFLRERGNPYRRLGRDGPGRVAIDWGVYGVPETYLLDREGIIRWRFAGPVTADVLEQEIRPLLRRFA